MVIRKGPPKYKSKRNWLRIPDIPTYVEDRTGVIVNRSTVYNWVQKGRIAYSGERVKLRTTVRGIIKFTTQEWVDDFLQEFQEA